MHGVLSQSFYGGDGIMVASVLTENSNKAAYDEVNDLIEACSTSKECLCTLYNMFKDMVFAISFGITSDYHLSEDCVTETFIRLSQIKKINRSKGDGKGLIITVARNTARELYRKFRKNRSDLTLDFYFRSYGDPQEVIENSLFVNELLSELSDKQRQTVVLKCCAELTFREIAKIMKCPESTAKSRYKKAIEILQEKAGASK